MVDNTNKTINQRITRFRKLRGLSQAQVAEMMDMKGSTYSQLERRGHITCDRLIKLSAIFKVNCYTLMLGENFETTPLPEPPKPEIPKFINSEQSLIKVVRTFPPKKRSAINQIISAAWKNKLDLEAVLPMIKP